MHPEAEGLEKRLLLADAEVVLAFDDAVHSQGDRVRGSVTVLPHDVSEDKEIKFHVGLREIWRATQDDDETGTLTTRSLGKTRVEVALSGGEEKTVVRRQASGVSFSPARCYRFSLPLEHNSRFTSPEGGWQFVVRQDEARAAPDFARVDLPVEPAEEFLAIAAALVRGLRFREIVTERRWDESSVATVFRFSPPPVLSEKVDYLELELLESEGAVKGNMIVELEERSLGSYFKSFLGLDREERSFEIPCSEISIASPEALRSLTERVGRELAALLGME
jgi:hypothetical protein